VNCSRHFDWYLSTLDVSQSIGETGLLQGVYDCFLHLGTWICPILTVLTAKKTLDIMIIIVKHMLNYVEHIPTIPMFLSIIYWTLRTWG
jgi:hypothetical protein